MAAAASTTASTTAATIASTTAATTAATWAVLGAVALALAALPLAAWWLRQRRQGMAPRLAALTTLALFLTFDLIVFGAFTRLTDSGLGCPDWPGCYAHASPLGAHADIATAQAAMPTGPVTWAKAWIEMLHRYLAMAVGLILVALASLSTRWRHALPHSPALAWLTLAWVVVQGLFGRATVTWKLYPVIVTAHLLGAMLLLALLVVQREGYAHTPSTAPRRAGAAVTWGVALGVALLWAQVALGGWVSTNYAVLACQGVPQCNGQWWPAGMAFAEAFAPLRDLGHDAQGRLLPFDALVAIHFTHRVVALGVIAALAALAWRVRAFAPQHAAALAALLVMQVSTGLSNVVLGWPLAAALLHTAGAAALVAVTTSLAWRVATARAAGGARASQPAGSGGAAPAAPAQPGAAPRTAAPWA